MISFSPVRGQVSTEDRTLCGAERPARG